VSSLRLHSRSMTDDRWKPDSAPWQQTFFLWHNTGGGVELLLACRLALYWRCHLFVSWLWYSSSIKDKQKYLVQARSLWCSSPHLLDSCTRQQLSVRAVSWHCQVYWHPKPCGSWCLLLLNRPCLGRIRPLLLCDAVSNLSPLPNARLSIKMRGHSRL
jgi:hypothetical protein